MIMEADDDLVTPVRTHVRLLLNVQKLASQTAATGIDTYAEQFNAVNWKEAKKSDQNLKRKLGILSCCEGDGAQ